MQLDEKESCRMPAEDDPVLRAVLDKVILGLISEACSQAVTRLSQQLHDAEGRFLAQRHELTTRFQR